MRQTLICKTRSFDHEERFAWIGELNNQGTKAQSRTEPTAVDGEGKTLFAPVKGFSSRLRVGELNNQGTKAQSRTEPTEGDGEGKTLFALFAPVKGFSSRLRVFVVKSVFICVYLRLNKPLVPWLFIFFLGENFFIEG